MVLKKSIFSFAAQIPPPLLTYRWGCGKILMLPKLNVQYALRRMISPTVKTTYTLRLTSELVDLRVSCAKRIRRVKLAELPLLSSVNVMHAVTSYLRRVIEVVITRRS